MQLRIQKPQNDSHATREQRPPNCLGEWVTVASEDIAEPTTVREALSGPYAEQWHKAMRQDINSLHKHVWTLTELPEGRKVIRSGSLK